MQQAHATLVVPNRLMFSALDNQAAPPAQIHDCVRVDSGQPAVGSRCGRLLTLFRCRLCVAGNPFLPRTDNPTITEDGGGRVNRGAGNLAAGGGRQNNDGGRPVDNGGGNGAGNSFLGGGSFFGPGAGENFNGGSQGNNVPSFTQQPRQVYRPTNQFNTPRYGGIGGYNPGRNFGGGSGGGGRPWLYPYATFGRVDSPRSVGGGFTRSAGLGPRGGGGAGRGFRG